MAATSEKMKKKKRIVRGLPMAFGVLGGGGIYKRREPSKQISTAEEQSCALACKAEGGDVVLAAPSASGQLYMRIGWIIPPVHGVRSRLLVGGALFFLLLCVRHHRFLVANCRRCSGKQLRRGRMDAVLDVDVREVTLTPWFECLNAHAPPRLSFS
jgi:hypothetical protein